MSLLKDIIGFLRGRKDERDDHAASQSRESVQPPIDSEFSRFKDHSECNSGFYSDKYQVKSLSSGTVISPKADNDGNSPQKDTCKADDPLIKGNDFEKYVANLFNYNYFSIYAWTSDESEKHDGKWIETNCNPDIIMRFIPRNEKFAIECKFRSKCYEEENIKWSNSAQIGRYNQFEQENSIPTFIVIGLGGNPSNPERMFCIPLKDAKYPVLFPIIYEKFERSPTIEFCWKDGIIEDPSIKGHDFEEYVLSLFNEEYFELYGRNVNKLIKQGDKWVESNNSTDLIMRYIPRNEKIAIECKHRPSLENGNLRWSYRDQIDRFNQFEQETSIPTFIVVGLGGDPSNPERMFCIPLKDAKYPVLFPSIFENFERPPNRRFFWRDGILR